MSRLAVVSTVVAVLLPLGPPGAGAAPSASAGDVAAPGSWGPAYPVRLNSLSTVGESTRIGDLAMTVRDGAALLHAVTTGPGRREDSALLAYGRTADEGKTWTARKRLSPASHKVLSGAVAATGSYVYAAWLRKLPDNAGTTVYLRTNSSHGRPSAWSRARLLGRGTSSVLTTMSITASGSTVVVASLSRGKVLLWTSRDRGRSWTSRTVGSTAQRPVAIRRGTVGLGSSGSLMAVTWTVWNAGGGKQTRVRISQDRGRHWSAAHVVASCCGTPSVAVSAGRVVVAVGVHKDYASGGSIQTWRRGTWEPRRVLPLLTGGGSVDPVVVVNGVRTVGITYAEWTGGPFGATVLRWRESTDDGATWAAPVEVWEPPEGYGEPVALPSSVVWRAGGPLHVLYSALRVGEATSTEIVTRR